MEIKRSINFKGLALSFVKDHKDYSENLGQLKNLASYHAMMHNLEFETVYDKLLEELVVIFRSKNENENGM